MAGARTANAYGTEPLNLAPIGLAKADRDGKFNNSGYTIQWSRARGHVVTDLCIGREDMRIPVTLSFGYPEFRRLLAILRSLGVYGVEVPVWLRGKDMNGGDVTSNIRLLRAPVKPFRSPLTIQEVEAEANSLPYLQLNAGDRDPDQDRVAKEYEFAGRLLSKEIDGFLYQVRGRRLGTYTAFRGFDCITFAASMLGLHIDLSGKTAEVVADTIVAQKCGLEKLSGDSIRRKCAPGETLGYHFEQFIAYYAKHTVLIGNGEVFEFSRGRKRFFRAPVHLWEGWNNGALWTIRKIPEAYRFKML